jgi:hypothetical protein
MLSPSENLLPQSHRFFCFTVAEASRLPCQVALNDLLEWHTTSADNLLQLGCCKQAIRVSGRLHFNVLNIDGPSDYDVSGKKLDRGLSHFLVS